MSGAEYLLFILMLSIFLGFELINKVPATLHTPLMSGANAISALRWSVQSHWRVRVTKTWRCGWALVP